MSTVKFSFSGSFVKFSIAASLLSLIKIKTVDLATSYFVRKVGEGGIYPSNLPNHSENLPWDALPVAV